MFRRFTNLRKGALHFSGDEVFPLQSSLLRPCPGQGIPEEQRIFNCRLSRARRVIENVFDIFAARWRVFMQPTQSIVEKLIDLLKLQYTYITLFGRQIVLATVRRVSLILMTKQGQSKRENGGVQSVITTELHYFKTSPCSRITSYHIGT